MGQKQSSSPKWKWDGMLKTPTFHEDMKKTEAEMRLDEQRGSCYLTRYSSDYKLSVKRRRKFSHFRINMTKTGDQENYSLKGKTVYFSTISDLLEFYEHNPVNSSIPSIGIGLNCLEEPNDDDGAFSRRPVRRNSLSSLRGAPTEEIEGFFKNPSYHGAMKGVEAERRLKEHGGNCCLTRYSEARSVYVISMYRGDDKTPQFGHFDILLHGDGQSKEYEIVGTEKCFDTVQEMLTYYHSIPINHQIHGVGDYLTSEFYDPMAYRKQPQEIVLEDLFTGQNEEERIGGGMEVDKVSLDGNTNPLSLAELTLLKWKDNRGKVNKLTIIDQIASRWWNVGILLGFTMTELETLQQRAMNDSIQSCRHVFSQWIDKNGHPTYPLTWNGLQELLVDIQKETLAKQLSEALASKTSGTIVEDHMKN